MSISYSTISGIGFVLQEVSPYMDDKAFACECLKAIKECSDVFQSVDDDAYKFIESVANAPDGSAPVNLVESLLDVYGVEPSDFAEFFLLYDKNNVFTWAYVRDVDSSHDGNIILYYTQTYPWNRREGEPQSVEDVYGQLFNMMKPFLRNADSPHTKELFNSYVDDGLLVTFCC